MKARLIIDDVTRVPHPFVYRGKEYDLQKSFTVIKAITEYRDSAESNDYELPFVALAAMINDSIIRNGDADEFVTARQLMAWIPGDQFAEVSAIVHDVINPDAADEPDTSELEALIDDEIPEEVRKN